MQEQSVAREWDNLKGELKELASQREANKARAMELKEQKAQIEEDKRYAEKLRD